MGGVRKVSQVSMDDIISGHKRLGFFFPNKLSFFVFRSLYFRVFL